MLNSDLDQNYRQFFYDAIETGCVWGLQNSDGWAQCASEKYSETPVMPFWSQPEYASTHQHNDWASYEAVPIALEEFLEDWLPGMHEDVVLVGINWNEALEGKEFEPLDVLHEFDQALEKQ